MKAVLTWMLVWLAAGGTGWSSPVGSNGPQSRKLGGLDYLSLTDWVTQNELQPEWVKKEKSLVAANRLTRLEFEADTRDISLNGVKVRLSFPILLQDGGLWVSRIDAQAALKPAVHPPRNPTSSHVRRIVLDPGHGGKDPGFQDGSRQEKRYALLLALDLAVELRRAGYEVFLTRGTDKYIERELRPELARVRKADLFISLHWNSVGTTRNDVQGAQVYCLTPAGAPSSNASGNEIGTTSWPGNRYDDRNFYLAYAIQRALKNTLGAEDRGVLRARFEVLRLAEVPAVLVEGGFMSNPVESRKIYDPAYRHQMARAIVAGVRTYQSEVERTAKATPKARVTPR